MQDTLFTSEQMDEFQKHLRKGNRKTVCPVCGNNDWTVPFVIAAPKFSAGNIAFDQQFPMIPSACSSCGYVLLFGAVAVLGKNGI